MNNCTITRNEQFNSFELLFNGKPDEATRDLLKANGYRWHGQRKIWYGYKDIADQLNGAQVATDSPKTQNRDADKEQQRLINQYAAIYGGDDKKSVDYMRNSTAAVIRLDDGLLFGIEKPRIETRFCFGYGQNGISSQADYENAAARMHNADTNESYFLRENLNPLFNALKKFDTDAITAEDDYYLQRYKYKKPYFCGGQYGEAAIAWVEFFDMFDNKECEEEISKATAKGFRPATDNEIQQIIAAYNAVIEQFRKRLTAYLKRYGLSKLHTWTYLSD